MKEDLVNPFTITKAVDFSDEQIRAYFVDMPLGGFEAMANPRSPMPMLIIGGKGSGKTHLMRYFSYPLQRLRAKSDPSAIRAEGYLGIYLRCGGLNAARFRGKNQSEEAWDAVFAYYMELWLAQLVLACASDYLNLSPYDRSHEEKVAGECFALLDKAPEGAPRGLADVRTHFHRLQRELDTAINNSALTRELNVVLRATSGRLVFGLPQLLSARFDLLSGMQFVYLLDEYENLMIRQQQYVNTLLREKELPCSFKIGGRTYGFKTYRTFSDQEDIKEGSEYEVLQLDLRMRSGAGGDYRQFAKRLCFRRLEEAGYVKSAIVSEGDRFAFLEKAFETLPRDLFCTSEVEFVKDKYGASERPYFDKLARRLERGVSLGIAPGVKNKASTDLVLSRLRAPDYPLLEKLNIYLLYKDWRTSKSLPLLAKQIHDECDAFLKGAAGSRYARQLDKRRNDLLAQLYRECEKKQQYIGLDTFIDMSQGLPRNLLVILKAVFNWSMFQGEGPFTSGTISITSQREGVREAAEWFFDDARMPGDEGEAIRAAIRRLATLFREIRYSDKPSEKALCTFSADLTQCSANAKRVILLAEKWSLLLRVEEGQKDKNTFRIDEKLFINPMLSPKWDLSVVRGGALALSAKEVNAIFDDTQSGDFEALQSRRVGAMTAPSFGQNGVTETDGQTNLRLE
jgi:hypothetical protein